MARWRGTRRDITVEEKPVQDFYCSVEYRFAGIDVFLQAQMSDHGKGRICLRREDTCKYIDCVHTVVYQGPVEEMPGTLSIEHPKPNVKLPSAKERFFALESLVQVVAELGFVALRTSMLGNIVPALEARLISLMGGDAFYPIFCDTLAVFAGDLPRDSPEWEEIAHEVEEEAKRAQFLDRPSLQPLLGPVFRKRELERAAQQLQYAAKTWADLYKSPLLILPCRISTLKRQEIGRVFSELLDASRKRIFERVKDRAIQRARRAISDGSQVMLPPHPFFKRPQSPFRKLLPVNTESWEYLVTGGIIDHGRVLGLTGMFQHARKTVLLHEVQRRMKQSEGGIVHFWPHYLLKRKDSPFRKVLNLNYWEEQESELDAAKSLAFESAMVDGVCWRYFRLGFTAKNYSFQETLWKFLTHEGWNDCYYRFKQKPPEKSVKFDRSWIMILDPWTNEEFPITSGGTRLQTLSVAETERQTRLPGSSPGTRDNSKQAPHPAPPQHVKPTTYEKTLLDYIPIVSAGTEVFLPAKQTPPHPLLPPPPAATQARQEGQVIPTNPSKPLPERGEHAGDTRVGDTITRGDTHE